MRSRLRCPTWPTPAERLGDHNKITSKDLLERALKIKEQHFGEDHFEVAITLVNLGNANGELGDHKKKKDLLERALEIEEKHFGEEHFEVGITLYNLALAHGDLGDRGNKARILTKVLPIFERHFGMHHENCGKVKTALNDTAKQLTEGDQQNPVPSVGWFFFLSSLWRRA